MKKKKSALTIAGIVCIVIGIIGMLGLFTENDKLNLFLGSAFLIVLGFALIAINKFTHKDSKNNTSNNINLQNQQQFNNSVIAVSAQTVQKNQQTEKKEIKNFTLDEAISVYCCTEHSSCPVIYDYKQYFTDAFNCIADNVAEHKLILSNDKVLRKKELHNPITNYKNITKTTNCNKIKNFVAIDCETTGLKVGGNDIIELAAIKFVDFKPIEKYHTYLRPRNPIPTEASAINHITDDMVANSPIFAQICADFQNFVQDFAIVAHNASFDMKFLHVSGLDLSKHTDKVYDTYTLAKNKIKGLDSYKLSSLCEEQNIQCSNYHTALADALACGLLFIDLVKIVKEVKSVEDL